MSEGYHFLRSGSKAIMAGFYDYISHNVQLTQVLLIWDFIFIFTVFAIPDISQ